MKSEFTIIASKRTSGILLIAAAITGLLYQEATAQFVKSAAFAPVAGKLSEGPWGKVTFERRYIEAPDSLLKNQKLPAGQTVWRFPGLTIPQVNERLKTVVAPESPIRALLTRSTFVQSGEETRIFPTDELIEKLTPEQRSGIYRILANWKENRYFYFPIQATDQSMRSRFSRKGISDETLSRIETLSYRENNTVLFSDISYVIRKITDPIEERSFLRSLSRTPSYSLNVQTPVGNAETFRAYWSADGRNTSALPILESMLATKEERSFEFTHLLPPLARKHLYSFPARASGADGIYPGHWWMTLNFFAFEPRAEFSNREVAFNRALEAYDRVESDFRPGDIFLFYEEGVELPVHSCVYIAERFVYSKRSDSIFAPWAIVSLDQLKSSFPNEISVKTRRLKKKAYFHPIISIPPK